MSIFLDWFTTHIAGVIQTLAGLIICVTLVFAYRLFFIKSIQSSRDNSGSESNPTLDFIEEKLNKLLIQQSALKVTASSLSASGDISSEQVSDISRLKDMLKQKENEILNLRNNSSANTDKTAASSDVSVSIDNEAIKKAQAQSILEVKKLNDQLSLYQTQIDDLKSRLSDYEIIAEDIADLQKFKKENELLKDQLSSAGIASEIIETEPEEQPALTDEEKSLHLAGDDTDDNTDLSALLAEASEDKSAEAEDVAAPVVETPKEEVIAPMVTPTKPASSNPKQDEIDSLFAEFSPDVAQTTSPPEAADPVEEPTDTTLTENEKSLIDDFSKTQKG